MLKEVAAIFWLILVFAVNAFAAPPPGNVIKTDVVTITVEQQYETVKPGSKSALAVHFELEKGWYFYASSKTAQGGMNLKLKPTEKKSRTIVFSKAVFPQPIVHFDKFSDEELEVFSGKFTVFIPLTVGIDLIFPKAGSITTDVEISIEGAVCSGVQCRMPDFGNLGTVIKITPDAVMSNPRFSLPEYRASSIEHPASSNVWFALGLAFLAGLSLNIMPCVWPILPIIVMRIVEQAKQNKNRTITMGLAFCLGILLFFASLAGANIVLQVFYGTVLQWGDQFRNPAFVAAMAFLLVVLALFMFDVFAITVPAAVSSKSSTGKGHLGTVGMGFLAAVLSTPCSFAILAAAFAWAQVQPLPLATLAIMIIGVGMAVPYAILTSMPGLLNRLPKPGRWMEISKQAVGFILLFIAIWLITVLPQQRRTAALYFALILSFCVWMFGSWVRYNTKPVHKWLIRITAVALAVAAGLFFLTPTEKLIDWQKYDGALIETALAESRPVLIEFTAEWCLSCNVVGKTVYSRKDIAKLIEEKNVLAIKADTTVKNCPATLALKNVYNEPGVPVSILLLPGKKEAVRWRGKSFADELKGLLEKLPSK
ncbi:MAG: hypothetical protein DRP62_00665 [Planctomycetota bacterium]|nr:MAG: hypothetical protein DRP62_00665 [Planctomycetota bacterium]